MDLGLHGKRALVLASSRGLGLGIAKQLAMEGCRVIITGRSPELAQTAQQLRTQASSEVIACPLDLSHSNCVDVLKEKVSHHFGSIDILINNSGGPRPGSITDFSQDDWQRYFEMMVLRIISITNTFIDNMRKQQWGRILTIASSSIEQPISNLGLSNALRSTLVGWSKTLANEVAPDGVTCNMLLPGRIHTHRVDQLDKMAAEHNRCPIEQIREQAARKIPVQRYGSVEEFAATAAFLVSSQASYITGSKIRCDGGAIAGV